MVVRCTVHGVLSLSLSVLAMALLTFSTIVPMLFAIVLPLLAIHSRDDLLFEELEFGIGIK